jgi:hypothetical protein
LVLYAAAGAPQRRIPTTLGRRAAMNTGIGTSMQRGRAGGRRIMPLAEP